MWETTVVLRKELRDAVRSRWLFAFAVTFALVTLLLSAVQGSGGELGAQGFNRTTAGLINLCLLLVPLFALILGAGALAGERERGTMATLLAQPISVGQLIAGKYLGLTLAVWMAIALGFGGAGMLMALVSPVTDFGHYLLFVGLSGILASAMLSIGMLISAFSEGRLKALSLSIVVWFVLVLVYDLGAVGMALSVSSSGQTLLVAVLGNPIEGIRILAIMSLESDLEILGPLGSYMSVEVGEATSIGLIAASLSLWVALPLLGALHLTKTRDA